MEASVHQQVSSPFKQGIVVNKCRCLSYLPPPPQPLEFLCFSNLVWYPLERIFQSKMLLHYTFRQENIFLITGMLMQWQLISMLPCRGLSSLIIITTVHFFQGLHNSLCNTIVVGSSTNLVIYLFLCYTLWCLLLCGHVLISLLASVLLKGSNWSSLLWEVASLVSCTFVLPPLSHWCQWRLSVFQNKPETSTEW